MNRIYVRMISFNLIYFMFYNISVDFSPETHFPSPSYLCNTFFCPLIPPPCCPLALGKPRMKCLSSCSHKTQPVWGQILHSKCNTAGRRKSTELSDTGHKLQPCLLLYNGDWYNLIFVFTNHEFSMELWCD